MRFSMIDDVLQEKLESLRRSLERVRLKMPLSVEILASDLDAQDIVTLNLERSVQSCVDIALHVLASRTIAPPKTMAEAFTLLASEQLITDATATRMVKAVGFRNLAVHAYRKIDWAIVYAIGTTHLDDFRAFMREIVAAVGPD